MSMEGWTILLQLAGGVLGIVGTILMANLYINVNWYQVPGMFLSALTNSSKALGDAQLRLATAETPERIVMSVRGLALLAFGFLLQSIGTVLSASDEPVVPPSNAISTTKVFSYTFEGFALGDVNFNCDSPEAAKIVRRFSADIATSSSPEAAILFLVGSTDRVPLTTALRKRFESNSGLARARIASVEKCLGPLPANTIRTTSGPAFTSAVSSEDLVGETQDRIVRAMLILQSPSESSKTP